MPRTLKESSEKTKRINRLRNVSAAAFTFFFALYIGVTLNFQYKAFKKLNKTRDYQTQKELEKRAISLNYFFVERKNDLKELISAREVTSYYENKALGMSLQYGLRSSLESMKQRFEYFLNEKTYENKLIYSRVALLDNENKCLIDTEEFHGGIKGQCNINSILENHPGLISDGDHFIFKTDISFKNRYEGILYAWIKKDFIEKNFIINPVEGGVVDALFSEKGMFIAASEKNSDLLSIAKENLHLFKEELNSPDFSGKKVSIYKKGVVKFFGSKLKNSNYYLMEFMYADKTKEQSPIFFLSAIITLLAGVILGLIFWWRLNAMNFSLEMKVNEQIARKETIKEKNIELKKENIKRRAAERTLYEYTKNLEKIIQQKTAHLEKALKRLKIAQSQLVQSEKMASIGLLSAGIAHEINNPLGFIKTNLSSIKNYINDLIQLISQYEKIEDIEDLEGMKKVLDKVLKTRQEIDLDFIREDFQSIFHETGEGIERILSIISDLKFFSHKEKQEMSEADIHQCINSTLNMIHNEIKYKAEIVKEFSDIPKIKCYPQRINQILTNLLINAAQAIEVKGEIRVKTYKEDNFVIIKISDTGPGIPEDIRDKIFDPFFSTKPVGQGTGLGLHVVYNLVKKHNGKIKIESSEKGTSFIISLPIRPIIPQDGEKLEK